jgi:hypothetical protein
MCVVAHSIFVMNWQSSVFVSCPFEGERVPDSIIMNIKEKTPSLFSEESHSLPEADEAIMDIVGSFIHGAISMKQILAIFNTIPISSSEIAKAVLTDTVWFWGIQVSSFSTFFLDINVS